MEYNMNRFNIGDSFETTVVAVTDTTVVVDLSAKSEGVVDLALRAVEERAVQEVVVVVAGSYTYRWQVLTHLHPALQWGGLNLLL